MNVKVTLKDVAKEAGVSYQTVSKVLRGQIKVTQDTQDRIETAVSRLGYRPNTAARNLRTQSSNLIGYGWLQGSSDSPHPVLNQFLYSAVQRAELNDFHLLTFLIEEDIENTIAIYRELHARRQVEGFILADTNDNDPRIRFLMEENIPFASFGRANDAWDFGWVDVDGSDGMHQTTAHLQEQGHTKIALITWPEGSRAGEEREKGYFTQMAATGLTIDPEWIVRGENTVHFGYRLLNQLIALPTGKRPTAVACVSDEIAIGAMNAALAQGLQVGSDLAVTGYDNLPMSEFLFPALTTVEQPIQEAGSAVIEMLLKQINNQPLLEKQVLLKPQLIIRQSSGA
ncbi:LacI family DNA-binding transcriptional regulator [Candidatus Leptofilum sp.]|uniref:LacI family DNA-binding transcriptional regulator n=1 Tax=Candidatus Leptofilum sp. TaxID=3241576 RepID=UPI003B590D7D